VYDIRLNPTIFDCLTLQGATLVNESGEPLDGVEFENALLAVANQHD
jgi:hypothetical protein